MGVLRRLAQVLLLLATLIVGAAAAAIIVSQTAWFKDWLRGLIVRQANQYLTGRLSIGRVGGNLFFGLEFEDLDVTLGGERVISVKSAGLDYSVIQFISGDLVVDHIRLDRPVVVLKKQAGAWNLGQLLKRQRREKERTGPGRAVTIGEVGISDGRFVFDRGVGVAATSGRGELEAVVGRPAAAAAEGAIAIPREIGRVDARFSFKYEPVRYTVEIAHLSLRGRDPDIALNALSGRIAQQGEGLFLDSVAIRTAESSLKVDGEVATYARAPVLNLTATSDKLSLPEIARLVPALGGMPLQPAFRVVAKGPLDNAHFDFSVRSSAGNASGKVAADLLGPDRGVKGDVHLDHLDLAPIVKTPAARSDLSGLARVDVRFPREPGKGPVSGTYSVSTFSARIAGYSADKIEANGRVDGRRVTVSRSTAVAYGAVASAAGTVEPGVRGRAGVRGMAIDLHGSVAGLDLRRLPRSLKVPALDSRLTFDYRVAGVGADVEGDARLRRSVLEGAELADETVGSFTTVGPTIGYSAEGGIANLDLQRYGRGLKIEALAADRFASSLNGRFSVKGSGTTIETLRLDAAAALNTSTLDEVNLPLMNVEAHVADGGGRFKADGGFSNLDPARLTGRADVKGRVAGRVNAEVAIARLSGPITADSLAASGEVALGSSTVGGLEIDKAVLAGQYRDRAGQIRQLTLSGRDIALRASGDLALGTAGASTLAYHVETPNLAAIGRLAGRKDLNGFLSLDGRVAGNGSDLRTQGDLRAGNVQFGGADVLTAQSRYNVSLPDLDAARAEIKADTTLGFLKVAGQEINVLKATTTYAAKRLTFDANAEQAVRQVRVAGALLLHPDHQEVHLNQLGFSTQGLTWALAPRSQPTVNYRGGDITLKDVHLVSGEQSIAAEGTIGRKESTLRAAVTNVDLARVDTLVVGERRLGGILNAATRITGPANALNVVADFSVDSGAFREFRYETLGGTVTYARNSLALDVRLQQGPQSWLTARGTLPLAMFASPTNGKPVPGADAPVDLAIKSSPIDLGLVQGFTGAITKASGTLLADVRVAGTAGAPRMSGQVTVTGGAFTVEPVGVSYTNLDGRVDLQPGRAVVERLGVTDEHGHTLQVSGEMGLQGRSVGELRLKVASRKFEVMHNDIGHLIVNTNLGVAGQLRAPQVTGDVVVDTGTIDLDRVLDMVSASAYSTRPQEPAELAAPPRRAGDRPVGTAGRGQTNPAGAPQAPPAPAPAPGTRPAPETAANAPAASGTPFDAATLNLTVKIPDALVLTGKDIQPGNTPIAIGNVNITLGGDLRVNKRPRQPMRVVGVVNTVRGTYDFQGRRFDIQRDGRVRLTGVQPVNPILDVTATRLIQGVEARVHVGGTMRAPELTLTSSPPLDQADILSLIIFNQPANQLGEGEQVSLAQRAGALATGFVAGKLADSIGRALNLDVFEIQTQATSQGGQAATVTVGEQVGRNLYVKVVQAVGAENTSMFVLDYTLTDWLRFQTTVSQGGSTTRTLMRRPDQTGGDLIFFFSY